MQAQGGKGRRRKLYVKAEKRIQVKTLRQAIHWIGDGRNH